MSCLHIFYKNDNEYEYEMDSFSYSYSLSMLTLSILGPLRTLIWNMPVRRTAHEYFVLGSHRYVLLAFK